MTDWAALAARASFASHRLIGWVFWDPPAIARDAALGVPEGRGYHIAAIEHRTERLCALIEPVGQRLVEHIDRTAGPNWKPAARERRR